MDAATIQLLANAATTLVPLAAQALQAAVASGQITADQANAMWLKAHSDWTSAYAGWQAQGAAEAQAQSG